MSTQIAVRLPDDLVVQLDEMVASGAARSRASIIEKALRRAIRQHQYAEEARLRDEHPERFEDPELDAWVRWSSSHPLELD